MRARILIGAAMAAILFVIAWQWHGHRFWGHHGPHADHRDGPRGTLAEVAVPTLSPTASEGEKIFNQNCAVCHGENAAGVDGAGPPLVHKIYEPSHHADMSFQLAVRQGVRQHHWRFGNMPAVPGVTETETSKIVLYVRELQRANGID